MTAPTITAKILAHSQTPVCGDSPGSQLISFLWEYPRFIHSEIMTYRAFSRNTSSSRAVPVQKMIRRVIETPASPMWWGANEKGMQAHGEVADKALAQELWHEARGNAIIDADRLNNAGLHKQIVNRVLEPYSHLTAVVTTALPGLLNMFAQRAHRDAQPEFQVLAYRALKVYLNSSPTQLNWGDWHAPQFDGVAWTDDITTNLRMAVAHCARTSYLNHAGVFSIEDDLRLFHDLVDGKHWSPLEHVAQAIESDHSRTPRLRSNFGPYWLQLRKCYPQEMQQPSREQLCEILDNRPTWFDL